MKTLYICRGLPGKGKSTLARSLCPSWHPFKQQVAADDMPGLYVDGQYNQLLQSPSHRWCLRKVERWMERGMWAIAVHNTFTQHKYIQPYLDLAAKHGYAVQVIHAEGVLLPDGSSPGSIHGVPVEVVDRMRSGWEEWS